MSRTQIVFHYAGDLWIAGREGGEARRLTYHPGPDSAAGWTRDGRRLRAPGARLLDLETLPRRQNHRHLDRPALRFQHREDPARRIPAAALSPTGARAVFMARGEILTVPAEKGDCRNLTNTPGVAERDPAWSPDSRWLACTKQLRNTLRAVFVYSLETKNRLQLTDGLSDATLPVLDRHGKHMYFVASTDTA